MVRLLVCALLLVAFQPAAADTSVEWMRIELSGQPAGHLISERQRLADGSLKARDTMLLRIARDGQQLELQQTTDEHSSASGEPLSFASELHGGGQVQRASGTALGKGRFRISSGTGTQTQERELAWPEDARLPAADEAALVSLASGAIDEHARTLILPDALTVVRSEVRVLTRSATTVEIEQRLIGMDEKPLARARLKLDPDGRLQGQQIDMMGMTLAFERCDQPCPLDREGAAPELFSSLLLDAPGPLPTRAREIEYLLQMSTEARTPIDSAEQSVRAEGRGRYRIHVRRDPQSERAADLPEAERWLSANRMVQSDDPAIIKFAADAVGSQTDPRKRMQALEGAVRRHLVRKDLSMGYASASEALAARAGDCTEHSVLLAAAARAQGIPARVMAGLVYAPAFAGRSQVFVPHAWVQAWVDGRWQSYDAAQAGFGVGHIALLAGDGDLADFLALSESLGQLAILQIQPYSAPRRSADQP